MDELIYRIFIWELVWFFGDLVIFFMNGIVRFVEVNKFSNIVVKIGDK